MKLLSRGKSNISCFYLKGGIISVSFSWRVQETNCKLQV